jgi:hypothetical protein
MLRQLCGNALGSIPLVDKCARMAMAAGRRRQPTQQRAVSSKSDARAIGVHCGTGLRFEPG